MSHPSLYQALPKSFRLDDVVYRIDQGFPAQSRRYRLGRKTQDYGVADTDDVMPGNNFEVRLTPTSAPGLSDKAANLYVWRELIKPFVKGGVAPKLVSKGVYPAINYWLVVTDPAIFCYGLDKWICVAHDIIRETNKKGEHVVITP